MSYKITQKLIPGLPKVGYRKGTGKYEGVVAHATAVWEDSTQSQTTYFHREWESRKAFVHFFVDHQSIVQHASMDYRAWGAGKAANDRFVHVELCQSRDKKKFQEAYKRYVWLLAYILHRRKLGVSRRGSFWTHHDVTKHLGGTTHTDPDGYLKYHGVSIDQLVKDVSAAYKKMDQPAVKSGWRVKKNGKQEGYFEVEKNAENKAMELIRKSISSKEKQVDIRLEYVER